ncbi:MAG: hypothetical protein U0414_04235 [Polyangiaceae bacterium]
MHPVRHLPRQFHEAGLALDLVDEPLAPQSMRGDGVDHIVQMDIARPPRRPSERFQIYPGAKDNRVEVLGVDRPNRQLVLFVHEPARVFTVRVPRREWQRPEGRVVAETARHRFIEQTTSSRKRHFLFGMDEQHLFMAELPRGVSSVHGARESLRAPEVPPNLRSREGRIVRQGEWFFLPANATEVAEVEAIAECRGARTHAGIAWAAGIARAGRPHVADEIVVIRPDVRPVPTEPRIYVRGSVRHPDHRTVYFPSWRRVVPNRERVEQRAGMLWID